MLGTVNTLPELSSLLQQKKESRGSGDRQGNLLGSSDQKEQK